MKDYKLRKQLSFYVLVVFFVIGFILPSTSFAKSGTEQVKNENFDDSIDKIIENDKTKEISTDEDNNEVIEIKNPDVLKKIEMNLDKADGEKLESFVVVREKENNDVNENLIQPRALASVKKTSTGGYCKQIPGARNSGYGDISLSVNRGITTTYSGGFGVTLGVINSSLGKSISKSMNVTATKTWKKPQSQYGSLQAYSEQSIINYNVYLLGIKKGIGSVEWGSGVCWAYFK